MMDQVKEIISKIEVWRKQNPLRFWVSLAGLIILALILAETIRRGNTGLDGKTLWDLVDLFIVSIVVVLALFWLNRSQKRREIERQKDDQQQAALQAYFDKMSELLINQSLGDEEDVEASEKAKLVARALTLSVFRSLDPGRNAAVLRFLSDAELLVEHRILRSSDMININFSKANLYAANLRAADLSRVHLNRANLGFANLGFADLSRANLGRANLGFADLSGAFLSGADLNEADLNDANLGGANLRGANLDGANLSGANLGFANLGFADLSTADLSRANLSGANLRGANLRGADLSRASLNGANLGGAKLRGAQYTNDTQWSDSFNPKEAGAILVDDEDIPIEDSDEEE